MKTAYDFEREFQRRILETIKSNNLVQKGDGVVVGVSGGPDSICLLHVLAAISSDLGIKLYALHINHMLRADEAMEDEAYTRSLCEELGVPVSVVRADIAEMAKKHGMSLEEAGRAARYREFEAYARLTGAVKIAVAHNRNDQAETIMLHIIRGSGIKGLTGMKYQNGSVIRPLLGTSRSEIEKYCDAVGLKPRTDSSNLECNFTRNRVRLELFPYINGKFGADIVESLLRLSGHAATDEDFLDQCAREAYENCLDRDAATAAEPGSGNGRIREACHSHGITGDSGRRLSLRLEQLKKLHPAILGRVLRLAACDVSGTVADLGSAHYGAMARLAQSGRTGARIRLPKGLGARVSYGRLEIFSADTEDDSKMEKFEYVLAVPGSTYIPEQGAIMDVAVEIPEIIAKYKRMGYNSLVQFFDYDTLGEGINIRNRRDGDVFKPLKSRGTKKLKEYFIDSRVPREKRDAIPLVCVGKEVVWVIGHKISDKFKVTENTKSVLKMEYRTVGGQLHDGGY